MKLTDADEKKLKSAHPDLVKIVRRAAQITECPFKVGQTTRSLDEQKANIKKGVSWTLRSRHLASKDGLCRAVDLLAMPDGKTVTWSWPPYYQLANAMEKAAKELNIPLEWGGRWKKTPDGPHFQLPWESYP